MPHDAAGREAMLDVAAELFGQKGYMGVSIRDIAQACDVTNAALYYHFKNKEDLYLAVLRRSHEQVMESVARAAGSAGDLRARLKQLVLRYGELMCEQRQSFQTMRRDLAHIDDARAARLLGEIHADFMRPIQQLIESGQSSGEIGPGDARLLARLLHGMIAAMAFEGRPGRPARVTPAQAEAVAGLFLDGAGARK